MGYYNMDDKEFEFNDEFEDENESPERQAFIEQFNSLVDQELNREKTSMINPVVMRKIYSAMKLIREIEWDEPPKIKIISDLAQITHSVRMLVTTYGKDFAKRDKDLFVELVKLSDEVDIAGANEEGKITIDFDFENYLIEVSQT